MRCLDVVETTARLEKCLTGVAGTEMPVSARVYLQTAGEAKLMDSCSGRLLASDWLAGPLVLCRSQYSQVNTSLVEPGWQGLKSVVRRPP